MILHVIDVVALLSTYIGLSCAIILVYVCQLMRNKRRVPALPWLAWGLLIVFTGLSIVDFGYDVWHLYSLAWYSGLRKLFGRIGLAITVVGAVIDLLTWRHNGGTMTAREADSLEGV